MNELKPQRRIGVIAIIVEDPANTFDKINSILHQHSKVIIGRLGLPYPKENLSIISLIIDGTTDDVGALTGKLGQIQSVSVKTVFAK